MGHTLPEEEGGHPAAKQLRQRQTVLGSGAEQAGREGQMCGPGDEFFPSVNSKWLQGQRVAIWNDKNVQTLCWQKVAM